MAFKHLPSSSSRVPVVAQTPDPSLVASANGGAPLSYVEDNERPTPWHRYAAALRRYRWLVLACFGLGAVLGYVGTRFVTPEYEAHATVWISSESERRPAQNGPIQSEQLLNPTGWDELFRSERVTDSVVLN